MLTAQLLLVLLFLGKLNTTDLSLESSKPKIKRQIIHSSLVSLYSQVALVTD